VVKKWESNEIIALVSTAALFFFALNFHPFSAIIFPASAAVGAQLMAHYMDSLTKFICHTANKDFYAELKEIIIDSPHNVALDKKSILDQLNTCSFPVCTISLFLSVILLLLQK
jgi:hypothetical protein